MAGHSSIFGDRIMEKKALIMVLAGLSMLAALATAMPATSQIASDVAGISDLASSTTPQAVVLAISGGHAIGGKVTFDVPYTAKVFRSGDVDYAKVSTPKRPASGSLNLAGGTGTLSAAEALPAESTTGYLNESAIPVAGANAVVILHDVKKADVTDGKYSFEFGKLSIYLPGETAANTFTLSFPIKLTAYAGKQTQTIEIEPGVASTIASTFASGITFPADSKPIELSSIMATK
jgi:hypothetical protein